MKCKNCNTENILKADYCKSCGNHFTKEEKETAYNKTIFGIFDKISDLWGKLKLEHITGSKYFKAASIIGLALYCIIVTKINGNQIRILDNSIYEISYATHSGKYYVTTQTSPVALDLYLPPKTQNVTVTKVDNSNTLLSENTFAPDRQITLEYNENYHYIISNEKEAIELYVVIR